MGCRNLKNNTAIHRCRRDAFPSHHVRIPCLAQIRRPYRVPCPCRAPCQEHDPKKTPYRCVRQLSRFGVSHGCPVREPSSSLAPLPASTCHFRRKQHFLAGPSRDVPGVPDAPVVPGPDGQPKLSRNRLRCIRSVRRDRPARDCLAADYPGVPGRGGWWLRWLVVAVWKPSPLHPLCPA